MSCLDNTDILRIVGGNSFQIAITVKARRVADGSEIEDFDLSASNPVLNLIHAGEKTRKYFVTQGNQAIISFDGSEGLGFYGMEMSGSYNSEAWRFCIEKVLQLVDTNAKANIPEWSVLVDDTYFVEGTISIYGGGGGGDTVQADWTETNPTSAAFILHKPDLSVYATKTEVASGLAGKQDTIVDLSSIRYGAAAGATAYQKPASGIPESDMSEGVQSALDKAEDAYQLPANGIPATDMDSEVQAALEKANSAVQAETDPVFSNSPAAEITQADINNWNAKQPAIADLADIREGAAAGATAVQPDEMAQAIDEVDGDIDAINAKIPAAASNLNQLADKAYVNSSIATNSATFRGSFNLITDLGMNVDATHAQIAGALATAIATADNNDYAFVQIPDSASTPTVIAKIERYKHNGSGWVYEYDLNNSGFTAAQWAAINSGITSGLVGKLADLPNNSELATLLNGKQNVINDLSAIRSGAAAGATAIQPADLTEALNDVEAEIAGLDESKQDTIEDLSTIRSGAAAGATAYQKPGTGIPESDMSEGVQASLDKADSAYQKPANGIPASDMDSEVQASLDKANSAVQTETDPVFSNSPAAEISQTDINNWNAKQPAIADLADIREGAAAGATAVQPDEMAQAIDGVEGDIDAINAKIPTAASNLNQLADKAYVNSSIATNSATYRGSFNLITDLGMNVDATHAQIAGALATVIVTADNNDYAFVQIPDSASTPTVIAKIERYKHNGSGWVYEYDLNNSGFTSAQWAAINSGITSGLVSKLADLPNNSELATLLNGKQNVINDLSAIRSGAAAGATAYQKPSGGIPASDMSSTVQQELSKANTAVQTETDPIFSASPAAGITAQNIQTWNGEPAARQAADTALQNSVSTLQTDLAAETSARQSADAALQEAIQNEATARATADALLQQQYNALTQSDIIVGALPASGVPNVIYRVPGTTDFTDYMWYDNQFIPMATYGLPISTEFVVDENLNKTQEEVNAKVVEALGGDIADRQIGVTAGGYYHMNGQLVSSESAGNTGLVEIGISTDIEYSSRIGDTGAMVAFFDSSRTFISSLAVAGTGRIETGTIHVSSEYSNAKYVCVSCYGTDVFDTSYLKLSVYLQTSLIPRVGILENKMESANNEIEDLDSASYIRLRQQDYTMNGYINLGGGFVDYNPYKATDFIKLSSIPKEIVLYGVHAAASSVVICFYDSLKVKVGSTYNNIDASSTPYTITSVPSDATYFRCSTTASYLTDNSYVKYDAVNDYATSSRKEMLQNDAFLESEIVADRRNFLLEVGEDSEDVNVGFTETGYYETDGDLIQNANAGNTGLVDISSYIYIKWKTSLGPTGAAVAFFDSNRNFIPSLMIAGANHMASGDVLLDSDYSDARYVCVSCYGPGYFDSAYLELSKNHPNSVTSRLTAIEQGEAGMAGLSDILIMPDTTRPNVLIYGDSISAAAAITYDATNIVTTGYYLRNPSNIYTNSHGTDVAYYMWPWFVNKILNCTDCRCYAFSGASYHSIQRSSGYELQNLKYQIDLSLNDLNNPNSVFPTTGLFNPDIVILALGTNDRNPASGETFSESMAKTVVVDGVIDVDATLAALDWTNRADAVHAAFLNVKKNFPYALTFVVLPIQRANIDVDGPGTMNELIRQFAWRYSIHVIDGARDVGICRDFGGNVDIYLKDGLHPNDKGQNLYTRTVLSAIRKEYVNVGVLNP